MINCIYFAEGQCEEQLLNALKAHPSRIIPGRVKVYNIIQNLLPKSRLLAIRPGSVVVLAFDTDKEITDTLKKNIELIGRYCTGVKLVFLPQVLNLEDELVRCTDVRSVTELTKSKSKSDFKRDFCALSNCRDVLTRHQLDVLKLWTHNLPEVFAFIPANSDQVKMK